MTKPDPSICSPHDGATARIFRIDPRSASAAALSASVASGGSTGVSGAGDSGSRICGNPESSNSCRSCADTFSAPAGITSLTPVSTADERMAEDSHG